MFERQNRRPARRRMSPRLNLRVEAEAADPADPADTVQRGNQQVRVSVRPSRENIAENKNGFRISFQFTAVIGPSEEKGG